MTAGKGTEEEGTPKKEHKEQAGGSNILEHTGSDAPITLAEDTEISADVIAAYLRDHPDFFVAHKSLLVDLNLPHSPGKTVSLVERQVDILRERNVDMRRRMNDLLETARINDTLFAKTRSLTLAVLDTVSLQALNEVLATHILADFEADFVACHLYVTKPEQSGPLDHFFFHEEEAEFNQLVQNQMTTLTTLRAGELDQIFPVTTHDGSGSAALMPLAQSNFHGLLAIGSRDPAHFTSDMDTLFLDHICDVLAKVVRHLLS
ncbi:MAG: DUF484 family protein [Pseudomonadales bacterium]|nr:DUF484 family protein [Pseudomonadales bacterium]